MAEPAANPQQANLCCQDFDPRGLGHVSVGHGSCDESPKYDLVYLTLFGQFPGIRCSHPPAKQTKHF